MKRYIISILMSLMVFTMLPFAAATSADAQTRVVRRNGRTYVYKRPNFYRRHRKAVNIGASTVGGAIIGGLIGGRKGAAIGGLAGAGGGYIYTKKQRPKHHYTVRRVRRY
jgi:uncharacterized protein YcfJ